MRNPTTLCVIVQLHRFSFAYLVLGSTNLCIIVWLHRFSFTNLGVGFHFVAPNLQLYNYGLLYSFLSKGIPL
jgi:hypothetical protein